MDSATGCVMTKPSGKLEFAYRTIAALEQKLEAAQARLAELEKQEPVAFEYERRMHDSMGGWEHQFSLYDPLSSTFTKPEDIRALRKLYAAPVAQAGQVPEGWRVMRCTSSAPRDGDKWEIYDPQGCGGVVSVHDVKDCAVRGLLDALSAAPQPAKGE